MSVELPFQRQVNITVWEEGREMGTAAPQTGDILEQNNVRWFPVKQQ